MENPIKIDDLGIPLFLETPASIDHSHRHPTVQQIQDTWTWVGR